jgi:predicted nuclease of predicted toxin-antitoxin system
MKFKIDENLPIEVAELLNQEGYEAKTVIDQSLGGRNDPHIAAVCQREKRVLITLDTDFGDIRTYPPEKYTGIIVLRLRWQDKPHILNVTTRLIALLSSESIKNRLWIVEEDRVRIRG